MLVGSVWWLGFVMVFLVVGFCWELGFSGGWVLFEVVVVVPLGFVWVFGDFLFRCLVS